MRNIYMNIETMIEELKAKLETLETRRDEAQEQADYYDAIGEDAKCLEWDTRVTELDEAIVGIQQGIRTLHSTLENIFPALDEA